MPYEYWFTVTKVHDGDTIMGDLDLGFYMSMKDVSLRIYGINAPELTTLVNGHRVVQQVGEDSTHALMEFLGGADLFAEERTRPVFGIPGDYLALPGTNIRLVASTVLSDSPYDKYGRILASISTLDPTIGVLTDVGEEMVDNGFAVRYMVT